MTVTLIINFEDLYQQEDSDQGLQHYFKDDNSNSKSSPKTKVQK